MAATRRCRTPGVPGFTLIELLAVIAIIMLVMAMALPNFVAMMKGQKWTAAMSGIQTMVWRGRALATNVRKDFSVEFDVQGDNGTWMWLESEEQIIERIPDLDELQHLMGGGENIAWIRTLWYRAGGTDKWGKYECQCKKCEYEWIQYTSPSYTACPKCGTSRDDGWQWGPAYAAYYYDFQLVNDPSVASYGDNARQSEIVKLGHGLTIDPTGSVSPNFFNWDSQTAVEAYGWDKYKDVRIGPNGALVQTQDPTICIQEIHGPDKRQVKVVRCTGRVVSAH
ncbi:MAG TPA: prepilin-type N-terminal cleavage/methylation domain-containing protein [Planctomycetota bacterium]|nr:prepilin-type N-terminal cleavage/methylation domain-containing protein [Planctomycetota bacterium]